MMDEALTPAQRIKRSALMKKMGAKMAKKRAISMKKKASPEKIMKRAMKKARDILVNKMIKGQDKSELGFSQKQAIEKKIDKKKGVIKKIAKKMLPKLKQAEAERIAKLRGKE
jgi:hypothetical protein